MSGAMKVARINQRVSIEQKDIERQEVVVGSAKDAGYYVAGTFRE
ncbi:hypothetical protein [Paraburkholderia pallida]|nr:hypothetical protein [Paraburkholderia pallida]